MKLSNNDSYNRIMDYLCNNGTIDEIERRFLIHYATQLYKNGVENIEFETLDDIYDSLKEYSENLKYLDDTSIVKNRLNEVIDLLQEVISKDADSQLIKNMSYRIDKLYCQTDLPVRKNSSLSYNLLKYNENQRKH